MAQRLLTLLRMRTEASATEQDAPLARDLSLALPEGPRRRMHRVGLGSLSEAELLALVLGATPSTAAMSDAAERLLQRAGGLRSLLRFGVGELAKHIGEARAARLLAAAELTRRAQSEPLDPGKPLASSRDVVAAWNPLLCDAREERVVVVLLDSRQRPLLERVLAVGGPSSCALRLRELFALAVREGAAALLLVHNHPGGDPSPSTEDRELTALVAEAGRLLDLPLVDHVILGREGSFSFLDAGLLEVQAGRA